MQSCFKAKKKKYRPKQPSQKMSLLDHWRSTSHYNFRQQNMSGDNENRSNSFLKLALFFKLFLYYLNIVIIVMIIKKLSNTHNFIFLKLIFAWSSTDICLMHLTASYYTIHRNLLLCIGVIHINNCSL